MAVATSTSLRMTGGMEHPLLLSAPGPRSKQAADIDGCGILARATRGNL